MSSSQCSILILKLEVVLLPTVTYNFCRLYMLYMLCMLPPICISTSVMVEVSSDPVLSIPAMKWISHHHSADDEHNE
jgi:hypothetical protein